MIDPLQHITELFAGVNELRKAELPAPDVTPEQRAALVEKLEGRADWHDDNLFAGRWWVPVEDAADVVIDAGWRP